MKSPMTTKNGTMKCSGTALPATSASSVAPISRPVAATRSCRVVRTARNPPITMPAVPPSRYAVTADVAITSGTPNPAFSAGGRNVCRPIDAVVWKMK